MEYNINNPPKVNLSWLDVEIESTYDRGHGKKFLAGVTLPNTCNGKSPLLLLRCLRVMAVWKRLLLSHLLTFHLGWQSKSDGLASEGSTCFH